MASVYLSLGSNLGDRSRCLRDAIFYLQQHDFNLIKASSVYETEPVGFSPEAGQVPWFLNQVVMGEWDKLPKDVLAITQSIERRLGRERKTESFIGQPTYFSRIIDIDVLMMDHLIFRDESLELPHPRFYARRYDLMPLCEIASEGIHPVFKCSFFELLNRCDALDTVRLYDESSRA
ncbi:MAG: hypothetical protein ACD_28C00108G0003 [uncultured bacterium]|nr:MAG: hypothetical protein ACD_28C00108G0003 [uncultured bacterium]KKT76101.1 MAG: 2-amino-4-hydroxy-6-hydroxymethyldihydropteridine pyrophosphokinase [Candidatus Peregrinibacteria bacterium GW2011_GWA2_44_7]